MTQEELKSLLDVLLAQWENEVVEFKRGGKGFFTGDIGEYFSALSNEANLACFPRAWLVFGVDNKTRKVVGTDYDASAESLNKPGGLKYQKLIDFLADFPGASREKINEVMLGEIAEGVPESKKVAKITNVLTYLRKKGLIKNVGTDTDSHWNLCKRSS